MATLLKTSLHLVVESQQFAKRAAELFKQFGWTWAGKTFNSPDYIPDESEILDRVNHLIDLVTDVFENYPDCKVTTQSMGRIMIVAHRSENMNILYDVDISLNIT